MRHSAQQIQLPLNPPQNLVRRRQEANIPQAPQIPDRRAAQVAEEAGVRDEKADDEDEDERRGPGGDAVVADGEVRVDAVLLYRFVGEQQEDPDAGADGRAVQPEDVAFEQRVEAAG